MNSNNRKKDNAVRGMFLTLVGGTLWGFSGTCGQFLMQTKGVTSNWLVLCFCLSAGSKMEEGFFGSGFRMRLLF